MPILAHMNEGISQNRACEHTASDCIMHFRHLWRMSSHQVGCICIEPSLAIFLIPSVVCGRVVSLDCNNKVAVWLRAHLHTHTTLHEPLQVPRKAVGGPGSAIGGLNPFPIGIHRTLPVFRCNQEIEKSCEFDELNDTSKNVKKPEDSIREQPKDFPVLASCECTFVITGTESTSPLAILKNDISGAYQSIDGGL